MMKDGTYDFGLNPIIHSHGYQVGLVEGTYALVGSEAGLVRAIYDIKNIVKAERFGVWTDEDGLTHVDPCVWVESLEEAETLGRQNKQKAIWCWVTMKEIHL